MATQESSIYLSSVSTSDCPHAASTDGSLVVMGAAAVDTEVFVSLPELVTSSVVNPPGPLKLVTFAVPNSVNPVELVIAGQEQEQLQQPLVELTTGQPGYQF